jgi:hypothetical protein
MQRRPSSPISKLPSRFALVGSYNASFSLRRALACDPLLHLLKQPTPKRTSEAARPSALRLFVASLRFCSSLMCMHTLGRHKASSTA